MANSENDSDTPKDDQAETPDEHDEASSREQSDEPSDDVTNAAEADDSAEIEASDTEEDSSVDSDADDAEADTSELDETEVDADEDHDGDDSVEASDSETDEDSSVEEQTGREADRQVESNGERDGANEDGDILMTERSVEDATGHEQSQPGVAAFFDHPDDLMEAARTTRDSEYEQFDVFSPFPVHGMDEAMGLGRSWIPYVTFAAAMTGLSCAIALQFGTMTFDWPLIIGGKPFAPWPAFVPVMFELSVLIGGVTTGVVMLKAAGCFQPAQVIDPDLTDDRFALWISADDEAYDQSEALEFVRSMNPTEVRTFTEEAEADG